MATVSPTPSRSPALDGRRRRAHRARSRSAGRGAPRRRPAWPTRRFAAAPWQIARRPPLTVGRSPSPPDRPTACSSRAPRRASDLVTPVLLRSIANAHRAPCPICSSAEVVPIADAVLQQWSRPPAPVDVAAHRDRRSATTAAGSGWRCCACWRSRRGCAVRGRRLPRANAARKRRACRLTPRRRARRRRPRSPTPIRRARVLALVEAVAWGAAAAAISPVAGALVAAAVAAWRWRTTSRAVDRARARACAAGCAQPVRHRRRARARRAARRSRRSARACSPMRRAMRAARGPARSVSDRAARLRVALFAALAWAAVGIAASVARRGSSRGGASVLSRVASPAAAPAARDCRSPSRSSRRRIPASTETTLVDPGTDSGGRRQRGWSLSIDASADRVSARARRPFAHADARRRRPVRRSRAA